MPLRANSRIWRRALAVWLASFAVSFGSSCNRSSAFNPASLTFLIEANPTNLDPRFATDGRWHPLPSHTEDFHRRTGPRHGRCVAGTMAQGGYCA
jgi:hypothetical protein